MKSAFVIAAALALCGSAFADTGAQQAPKKNGVVATVKQDAHQIGSSFRQDFHRMARGDKFREEQAADQHRVASSTSAMGAGAAESSVSSARQARMDAAYANWQGSHR
jgi:methylmalonyl-CoA mutase cobalamin-binding subunit